MSQRSKATPARRCSLCGRPCPPLTLEAVNARLRELLRRTPPLPPFPENPTEAEATREHERRDGYYSGQCILLRVSLSMLADEIDGVCTVCSKGVPD